MFIVIYTIMPYVVLDLNEYSMPSLGACKSSTFYITNYNLFTYGSRIDFDPNPHFKMTESDYLNNWYAIFNNAAPTATEKEPKETFDDQDGLYRNLYLYGSTLRTAVIAPLFEAVRGGAHHGQGAPHIPALALSAMKIRWYRVAP